MQIGKYADALLTKQTNRQRRSKQTLGWLRNPNLGNPMFIAVHTTASQYILS